MPSDLDIAVRWSKRFESQLEYKHDAQGRGLHEKIESVEHDLDRETVRALRLVATVRNKIVHEDGYDRIDRKQEFKAACKLADRALFSRNRKKLLILAVGATIVLIAATAAVLMGKTPFKIVMLNNYPDQRAHHADSSPVPGKQLQGFEC